MTEFKSGENPEGEKFYETEWQKISKEFGKDKNLVNKYDEFLANAFKEKAAGRINLPEEEKMPTEQKPEKQESDEWSLENLIKILDLDKAKFIEIIIGFLTLKKILTNKLIMEHKTKEAEVLNLEVEEIAEKAGKVADTKDKANFLIELKNFFNKYNVPDSTLSIDFLIGINEKNL